MNKNLLALVNKKNDKYRDWKFTNNDIEHEIKKVNFKTFEKIVKEDIKVAKRIIISKRSQRINTI